MPNNISPYARAFAGLERAVRWAAVGLGLAWIAALAAGVTS